MILDFVPLFDKSQPGQLRQLSLGDPDELLPYRQE